MGLQLEGCGGEQRGGPADGERCRRRQIWEELVHWERLAPKLRQIFEEEGHGLSLLSGRMQR